MKEFIRKWSNWWIFNPKHKQLDEAFEKELNELIEREVALRMHDVIGQSGGSLYLVDFIEEIEYMQRLYSNARFTQAEAVRDKLAEQLDDLMRLGSNDR